jgi:hypothetical protein
MWRLIFDDGGVLLLNGFCASCVHMLVKIV